MGKEQKACSVDGCKKPYLCKGYCGKHYQQFKKYGRVDPDLGYSKKKICSVEGCDNKHYGKGYCIKHYRQNQRHGCIMERDTKNERQNSVDGAPIENQQMCTFVGCTNKLYAKGLCSAHRRQQLKGYELKPLGWKRTRVCSVEGCGNKHLSRGFCRKHYTQNVANRCSFEGCNNDACSNGLCQAHRKQQLKGHELKPVNWKCSRLCTIDGCENKHYSKGYCSKHYQQIKKHGNIQNT